LTDPNTASGSTGDVTGVRTYSFAGSPVAMRVGSQVNMGASPKVTGISYVFSDAQGSVRGAMSDARTTTFAPSVSGATYQHMAYLPFGQTRGTDELTAYDKGWLGQVADGSTTASSSTGLVYLNARYYDPAASRFVSPDPVVKPSDPRTLDAYVYGANNPASFTDASGKWACPSYLTGAALDNCNAYANNTANYMTGAKGTSQAGTVHVVSASSASWSVSDALEGGKDAAENGKSYSGTAGSLVNDETILKSNGVRQWSPIVGGNTNGRPGWAKFFRKFFGGGGVASDALRRAGSLSKWLGRGSMIAGLGIGEIDGLIRYDDRPGGEALLLATVRNGIGFFGGLAGQELGEWGGAALGAARCGTYCAAAGGFLGGIGGGILGDAGATWLYDKFIGDPIHVSLNAGSSWATSLQFWNNW
jgi:RHS repeat-associated protein